MRLRSSSWRAPTLSGPSSIVESRSGGIARGSQGGTASRAARITATGSRLEPRQGEAEHRQRRRVEPLDVVDREQQTDDAAASVRRTREEGERDDALVGALRRRPPSVPGRLRARDAAGAAGRATRRRRRRRSGRPGRRTRSRPRPRRGGTTAPDTRARPPPRWRVSDNDRLADPGLAPRRRRPRTTLQGASRRSRRAASSSSRPSEVPNADCHGLGATDCTTAVLAPAGRRRVSRRAGRTG